MPGKKIKEGSWDTGSPQATDKSVMSPLEIFLASLGSCIGVYTVRYCQNANIDTAGLEIIVSSELGSNRPVRFEKINVRISLGQDIGARKRSLLEFVKNCPVHNTLSGKPDIDFLA
jgi:uncharacterized OsmC-like protein